MNPFEITPKPLESTIMDWKELRPVSYDKCAVDPYTRTRVILMNGTEFEAVWFTHQFSRNCDNNDIRRVLALIRRSEQMQQKLISLIKPANETLLEHTIGYEQLAVDLTAHLAQREPDPYVKKALDFALLEDFDHLYRYADFLDMECGTKAEELVGHYTELMPGRPTVAHYRHPFDTVRYHINNRIAHPQTRLAVGIITAAEQQTMNYYMNVAGFYPTAWGQKLYREIGMVEEQHVTQYGCLMDTEQTWLEGCLNHQYTECYLYWSAMETETDPRLKGIWEMLFEQEVSHLHAAAELLETYEGKEADQVIPDGTFPDPLLLTSNIQYVRQVLGGTVCNTALREDWTNVNDLSPSADFFKYQGIVNADLNDVESHALIERVIQRDGEDCRFETAPNPVPALRDRKADNTDVGRVLGSPC